MVPYIPKSFDSHIQPHPSLELHGKAGLAWFHMLSPERAGLQNVYVTHPESHSW